MVVLMVSVKNCQDCQFCKETRFYTSDSFEYAYDYWCSKTPADNSFSLELQRQESKFKKIAGYIERPSEMPGVPAWCPIREDREIALLNDSQKRLNKIQGEGI